jgi:hypothetical protein
VGTVCAKRDPVEIDADPAAVRQVAARPEKRHARPHFCDEAGPTGYGLYRQLVAQAPTCCGTQRAKLSHTSMPALLISRSNSPPTKSRTSPERPLNRSTLTMLHTHPPLLGWFHEDDPDRACTGVSENEGIREGTI